MKEVEQKIRQLKIPQLEVLRILVDSKSGVSSSKEIGKTTNTSTWKLGAMLTPLRRVVVNDKSLIIPAGRESDNSVRWQINEDLITREDLNILLVKMGI